jgi:SNF2 family DNA or RNA helicase
MTDAQRDVYQAYLQRARGELESADPKRSRFQILAALTRLRQICCHPRLVLTPEELSEVKAKPEDLAGGKFGLLEELLDECLDEGHRVLLFSQFTGVLDLIEERLDERGIRKERLDGSTRDREGVVRSFREDASIPIFLISLKAGGFGLNLTEADTVILYDPWWNPATEEQAAARAHRLGQTVPVHVHRLITAGTIEEKIVELQAVKKDLADRVIESEEEVMQVLGTDELKELLFS